MSLKKTSRRKKSFAYYLSVSTLGIVIAIFSLLIAYNYIVSRQLLLKNVEENARNITASAINKSEGFFNKIEKIAVNGALLVSKNDQFIKNEKSILSDLIINNNEIYGSCIAYKPEISGFDTVYNAPYYWLKDSIIHFRNLADKSYYYPVWEWYSIPVKEHRNIWSEPYYDEGGGDELMTTFSVPTYKTPGDTNSFICVLTVDAPLNKLNEMISEIKILKSGYAFLISRKGFFISHPDSSLIMNKDILNLAHKSNDAQFEQLSLKMLNGKHGFESIDKGFFNEKSWIYFTKLQNNDWILGLVFPESELYDDLHSLNMTLIIIFTSGILLLFILIIALSGIITKPARKLAQIMDTESKNFINIQIPDIGGSAEIETLNKSFRALQSEMKKYIANLKETTASKERMESEMNIARKLQLSMLPDSQNNALLNEKVAIISYIQPAREVGGDFYDFFLLDEKHLFFAVGDVSGKGVGAAMFMSAAITLLRAHAKTAGNDLCMIVNLTSEYLCKNNQQQYFVTLFTGILDIDSGEMSYINAGHNYPALLSKSAGVRLLKKIHHPPLGIINRGEIKSSNLTLGRGDKIFIYTDGLTESMNEEGKFYSTVNLITLLNKYSEEGPHNLIARINEEIELFTGNSEQSDDITMLCFSLSKNKTEERLNMTFENVEDYSILENIRIRIEDHFENFDISTKAMNRLILTLEELITNTVKYAFSAGSKQNIEISILNSRKHIEVEMRDTGIEFNISNNIRKVSDKTYGVNVIGKRGLILISKTAAEFDYTRENNLNIVRFKILK